MSNETVIPRGGQRPRRRIVIGAIVAAGGLLLVLANAHLVYVATTSQPECVEHSKVAGEIPAPFRAAKPAC